jgi:hypothetical protein
MAMSEPDRYVAYYRMPAIGASPPGMTLARQRHAMSAFLQQSNRILVGEFTEVMLPAYESDIPPAFQLAIDCCDSLDATLLSMVPAPGLSPQEQAFARQRGITFRLLDDHVEAGSDSTTGFPANVQTEPVSEAPYLDLKGRRRTLAPFPERTPVGNRAKADQFAAAILPIIDQIRASGATTLTDIARELNARDVRTARGKRWYPMTVRNILRRNRHHP